MGHHVLAGARRLDRLRALAERTDGDLHLMRLDVTDPADFITEPVAAQAMRAYWAHAITTDAIAVAVAYVIDQPADADVSEILLRPTRQR
ncbi:hypothetical protein AB0L82_42380 [Nocardia sp. NPDC052001]|uniref:hypothetical protein n=1 Tax=Nocardia sp. NPDC052001 TaxID=3154853 RepID=UPI003444A0B9